MRHRTGCRVVDEQPRTVGGYGLAAVGHAHGVKVILLRVVEYGVRQQSHGCRSEEGVSACHSAVAVVSVCRAVEIGENIVLCFLFRWIVLHVGISPFGQAETAPAAIACREPQHSPAAVFLHLHYWGRAGAAALRGGIARHGIPVVGVQAVVRGYPYIALRVLQHTAYYVARQSVAHG